MNYIKILFQFSLLALFLNPLTSHAWGRRGHQMVAENAALVVSAEPRAAFLRSHSFELGWYANVPDFFWKHPATNKEETPQHFMDMEIFERAFKKRPEIKDPFSLSRKDFDKTFPEIDQKSGRSFWRIREIYTKLEKATDVLKGLKPDTDKVVRQEKQLDWLRLAGVLAHYVGDMAMPLHASENHDGQLTDQKGVHFYYEDLMVDKAYPAINCEVNKEVTKRFSAFDKKNHDRPVLELMKELASVSLKNSQTLLSEDKKSNRKEIEKNFKMYRPQIKENLVLGSLYLAELYKRVVGGFDFDDVKFYNIEGEPKFIPTGEEHD